MADCALRHPEVFAEWVGAMEGELRPEMSNERVLEIYAERRRMREEMRALGDQ